MSYRDKTQNMWRDDKQRFRSSLGLGYTTRRVEERRKSWPRTRLNATSLSQRNFSFNSPDTEYPSPGKFGRRNHFDTPSKYRVRTDPHPTFLGYQLVGDSILLRFAEQILYQRCIYDKGLRYLGLCVSGQTIQELTQRIVNNFSPLGEQIILLIGTNNILQGHDIENMITAFEELLKILLEKVKKIVLLTLPPIPKLENSGNFWFKYNAYNEFLVHMSDRDNVFLEDLSKLYLNNNHECDMDYFEAWYDKQQTRPDRIHLNKGGLVRLREKLWRSTDKMCWGLEKEDEDERESNSRKRKRKD